MTEESYGQADPLSNSEVATAVGAARPEWELRAADPIDAGIDVLYRVTVETENGERDAVLKCLSGTEPFPDRTATEFLTEVRLLELVAEETTVPVPTVYGECRSHEEVPSPLYLMEAVGGVNAETIPIRQEPDVGERIARNAGRYLARIHDCRSFDAYGFLVADDRDLAVDGPSVDDLGVQDPTDSWTAFLRDGADELLTELADTRFADLQADLDEAFDERIASLDGDPDPEPVLAHNDFRHGNLHVDGETGEIGAVLDWGAARAGSRLFELVRVEFDLSNHAPLGSDIQERIHDGLLSAYEEERGERFDRDAAFERRHSLYRLLVLAEEMRWFDLWYDRMPEELLEERESALRDDVGAFLDGE